MPLPFRPRRDTFPADLWTQCPSCGEMLYNKQLEKNLRDLVSDPANLGVFSSLYDDKSKDNPVHCAIYRFFVYRADGTLAKFDFDWSD